MCISNTVKTHWKIANNHLLQRFTSHKTTCCLQVPLMFFALWRLNAISPTPHTHTHIYFFFVHLWGLFPPIDFRRLPVTTKQKTLQINTQTKWSEIDVWLIYDEWRDLNMCYNWNKRVLEESLQSSNHLSQITVTIVNNKSSIVSLNHPLPNSTKTPTTNSNKTPATNSDKWTLTKFISWIILYIFLKYYYLHSEIVYVYLVKY